MIVTIGTNDTLASPGAQLDYYQSVIDTMGRAAVDGFARLFVIPQASTVCRGDRYGVDGEGRTIPRPPIAERLRAVRRARRLGGARRGAGQVARRVTGRRAIMPLCSYPQYPRYVSGSPAAAASYTCVN